MKSCALSTVVFLPKICVDAPVQCSFNMKNEQVRKHTVKSTFFYSSNFGENANVFLQYDFVKMLIFGTFSVVFIFFHEIMPKLTKPQWIGELTFFQKNPKLNSRIVYGDQTLKNTNFSFKKQRISCFLSVILYGIFAIFTFFHFIPKSSKKSVVPSNIAWKENLKNCTFLPIFVNFHDL